MSKKQTQMELFPTEKFVGKSKNKSIRKSVIEDIRNEENKAQMRFPFCDDEEREGYEQ